ncbi:NAC domain-containing protein [Citrus sinensis]|nr:NAC domain-containing protein [Citrus sinensis]
MDRQTMMRRRKMNLNTIPLGRNLNRGRPPIVGRDLNSNPNPLGFSFCPNDEELLTVYLKNKLLNKPLPPDADAIKSLNIYMLYGIGSFAQNRNAGINGFWKATPGSSEKIYGSKSKTPLGYKKTLVFYRGKSHQANPTKTSWIMEEYKIDLNIIQSESDDPIWTGWVVCKVYNKEKDPRKIEADIEAYSLLKSKAHPIFPSY